MITLISRSRVKNGITGELRTALNELAGNVADAEPGTVMYIVNVQAIKPLDAARSLTRTKVTSSSLRRTRMRRRSQITSAAKRS